MCLHSSMQFAGARFSHGAFLAHAHAIGIEEGSVRHRASMFVCVCAKVFRSAVPSECFTNSGREKQWERRQMDRI